MNTPNAQMQVMLNQAVAMGRAQLKSISAIASKAGYLQVSEIDAFISYSRENISGYAALLAQAASEYPALDAKSLPQLKIMSVVLGSFEVVLKATHARRTLAGDQSIADLASLLRLNMIQMQAILLSIPTIRE